MRADFLDRHSRGTSPIHQLPAGGKLAGAVLIVVTVVLTQWPVWLGVAGLLIGVAALSRVPVGFLVKRLLWFEPVVLGMAILSLWQPGGVEKFTTLVCRSTLCVFTMILLANTTPFSRLLHVVQQLRVPAIFVTTLALLYRYLFVLVDEAERMQRARQARTYRRTRWTVLATVIGQLFVRSTERAERIYAAMCARGWK
ncbi:MAG: Energy-coupling factor transporter transmembrane protein EcfT [Verrucomicrobiae bacterium]|nr:Energy-coupling factor transporter transmembrane protein EcfT [Verrucomicrobiae bacterium]